MIAQVHAGAFCTFEDAFFGVMLAGMVRHTILTELLLTLTMLDLLWHLLCHGHKALLAMC